MSAIIDYKTGDATAPEGVGQKFIIHICNNQGGWGAGFVVAVSRRWPEPEQAYRNWHKKGHYGQTPFGLGQVQYIKVTNEIHVVNMVAQEGYGEDGKPPIRMNALESCLAKVAELARARKISVHMPRIGCGLAGGHWENKGDVEGVEALIARLFEGVSVTVYDFPTAPRPAGA